MYVKTFSNSELVMYTFVIPLIPTLFPILFAIFSINLKTDSCYLWILFIPIIYTIFWSIHFLILRNAFSIITIDSKGIHNKYISFNWSDIYISKVHLLEIEVLKYSLPKPIKLNDMLIIGVLKGEEFISQNPKSSIMISLTTKNKKLLKKYVSNISPIKDFI